MSELDPAGPILARLSNLRNGPAFVEIANVAGVVFELQLSARDDYSHSMRVKAYLPRLLGALNLLPVDARTASLSRMAAELVQRGIVEEDELARDLLGTGWCLKSGHLVRVPSTEASASATSAASGGHSRRQAVILTALELEAKAVIAHLHEVRTVVHPKGTVYKCGLTRDTQQVWDVAVVMAGMGNAGTAFEVERAVSFFNPEIILLVGVAGGIKDVGLGDVVAASRVHGYERGKAGDSFLPRPDSWPAGYAALSQARDVALANVWPQRVVGGLASSVPTAFVKPIAAGEKVVASEAADVYSLIKQAYGDAVAVDMEGAGFYQGAHASEIQSLVIRGVSDLIEGKAEADNAGWQDLAAARAAAFAVEFLDGYRPLQSSSKPAKPTDASSNSPTSDLAVSMAWRKPAPNDKRPGYEDLYHVAFHLTGAGKSRGRTYVDVSMNGDVEATRACISAGSTFAHEWRDLRSEEIYLVPVFTRVATVSEFWLDRFSSFPAAHDAPLSLEAGTYVVDEAFLHRLKRGPLSAGDYRFRVRLVLGDSGNTHTTTSDWMDIHVDDLRPPKESTSGFDVAKAVERLRELRREAIHEILNVPAPTQDERGPLAVSWIARAQDWDARVEATMVQLGCDPADIEFVRDFPLPTLRRSDFTYPMNCQWAISDARREKLESVIDSLRGRPTFRR